MEHLHQTRGQHVTQSQKLCNESLLSPQFKLKKFEDFDIDVAIDACGVCGSDVHKINGGWGEAPMPLCVGHEIVGKVVKTGPKVTTVKVGDRVGVGAQIGADLTCDVCKANEETCMRFTIAM